MEKRKVLVIDDESLVADMLALFCQSYGFNTEILNKGEDALRVAKSYRPDLVTVDLMMPGISGREVVEMLTNDPETSGIPIIVITSYTGTEEAEKILKFASAVVAKPVTLKDLGDKIEAVLASNN